MRYLITGGAGFVGTHLIERLAGAEPGCQVHVLDRMGPTSNPERLLEISHRLGVFAHEGDVRDQRTVDELVCDSDVIVHLAAESFVDSSLETPALFADVNIGGTINILEAARRYKIARLVHISTDEVWGEACGSSRFSEASPYVPRNPYAASKAAADHFVSAWGATWGLDYVIVHFTNLYGPLQYPEKLIPRSIARLLSGQPITLYGRGAEVRSWLYITDAVDGLLAATRKGKPRRSYIIGSGEELSNLQVAENLVRSIGLTDSQSWIEFCADRPGHDKRYAVDCQRANTELAWQPNITFAAGLEETVKWFRRNPAWLGARSASLGVRLGLS